MKSILVSNAAQYTQTLPCKQIWLLLFKIEMKQKGLQLQDYEDAPTLAAEMFGVGDFWLEIRVIIKMSHP